MNAMTETAAPVLPPYRADQRVTQLRVVRSEWIKLRSLPSAGWSLLATAVIIVGFGVLYTLVRAARPPHGAAAVAAFDPASVSLAGVQLAQLAIGVLGVLMITGEFATGLVNATLAAVPRRVPVLCGQPSCWWRPASRYASLPPWRRSALASRSCRRTISAPRLASRAPSGRCWAAPCT
jgi:hypothetical protein